jgi:hypothetical protein
VILLLVSTAHGAEIVPAYASAAQGALWNVDANTDLAAQGKMVSTKNPVYQPAVFLAASTVASLVMPSTLTKGT